MSEESKGPGSQEGAEAVGEGSRMLWVVVAILVVLGGIYFLSGPEQPVDEHSIDDGTGPIHVGVIAPFTGDDAGYGEELRQAYELAASEINEAGGVSGRVLELAYEDGGCEAGMAREAADRLLSDGGVQVILGGACSSETLAIAGRAQEKRALVLSPSATSMDITEAGGLVFRTYPSDLAEGALMARYAESELGAETAAIVSEEGNALSQALRKAFSEAFGGKLVFDETFDADEADFRTLVASMRRKRPDIVYVVPGASEAGVTLLEQMQDERVGGTWLGSRTLYDEEAFSDDARLYRDMVYAEVRLDEKNEKTEAFLKAFEEEHGDAPAHAAFAASAYDGVYLLAEAIAEVGADPEAIRDYLLERVEGWRGALGDLSFDENGDVQLEPGLVEIDRRGNPQPIEW